MIGPRTPARRAPRAPALVVVARRYLNPDAFPVELADAAGAAPPEVARIECHTLDDAVAAGRVLQASRTYGFHLVVEIVTPTGECLAHVSPNGRVRAGAAADWTPETPELEFPE